MVSIGVLALQGAFAKHIAMIESLGVHAIDVRTPEDLLRCDGLIIPGGESTTIRRQLDYIKLDEPLKEFAKTKPVFGTCAGLILMSSEILSDSMKPFNMLDVVVERNAFGRQYESFTVNLDVGFSNKTHSVPAVFIRAPRIKHVGKDVEVLARYEGEAVLVRQGIHMGATFHPELTHNTTIHEYFTNLVRKTNSK